MDYTIRDLAARLHTLGDDGFQQLFGDVPVLVVKPWLEDEGVQFDTLSGGNPNTPAPAAQDDGTGPIRRGDIGAWKGPQVEGRSPVLPLIKSTRNPFAGVITVGRTPNNDIYINSNGVSKLHAILRRSSDGWLIQDRNSTNGTFVEEERLEPNQERKVEPGATLGFGPIQALFCERDGLLTLCSMLTR